MAIIVVDQEIKSTRMKINELLLHTDYCPSCSRYIKYLGKSCH